MDAEISHLTTPLRTYESKRKDLIISASVYQLHPHPRFHDHDAIG